MLAAFLVTVAVIVPAGWHALDANIETDGKRLRPLQLELMIDGARVTLDVDRSLVMTGDRVTAKLVAFSDTPKQVAVDLTVLQSNNYSGSRVETPSVTIDHEKLVLTAAPGGGAPVATRIKLGTRPAAAAMTDDFQIIIAPHGVRAQQPGGGTDFDTLVEAHQAAGVAVRGWSGDSLMIAIEPQGPITMSAPFTVAVRVKNTSGHRLPHMPSLELATQLSLQGSFETGEDFDITAASDDQDSYTRPLRRGEELVERFVVVPKRKGLSAVTFVASATAWREQPGPVIAGALDVKTFTVADAKTVAVK